MEKLRTISESRLNAIEDKLRILDDRGRKNEIDLFKMKMGLKALLEYFSKEIETHRQPLFKYELDELRGRND